MFHSSLLEMTIVFRRIWSQVLVTHTECRPGDSQWTNKKKFEENKLGIYRN